MASVPQQILTSFKEVRVSCLCGQDREFSFRGWNSLDQNPRLRAAGVILLIYKVVTWLTEKALAPHSSTLVWEIPWMEEPGGLLSVGLHRVGHD